MGARGTVSPTAGSCPYPSYRPGGRKGWEGAVQAGAVKCRGRVGSLPPSRDEEPRPQEAKCWWSAGGAQIPPPGWGSSDPTSRLRELGSHLQAGHWRQQAWTPTPHSTAHVPSPETWPASPSRGLAVRTGSALDQTWPSMRGARLTGRLGWLVHG